MVLSDEKSWATIVHDVIVACRQGQPTYAFIDELLGPGGSDLLKNLRRELPYTNDLVTSVRTLRSELDIVAAVLALGVGPRSEALQLILFDALYVLWRFGGSLTGMHAIQEGERLLSGEPSPRFGLVHLKLGLLLQSSDPVRASDHFSSAARAGIPLPKGVQVPSPVGMPTSEALTSFAGGEQFVVSPATKRRFTRPSGDDWHGTFDLAQTELSPLRAFSITGATLSIDVSGGRPRFYVFGQDDKLIPELSAGDAPFIENAREIDAVAALVDDWHGGFNVCHAMFDKITRLGAYRASTPDEGINAVTFTDAPWYRQALASLGYGHIVPDAPRWSLKARRLLMLSNHRRGEVMHPAYSGGQHALDFIQKNWQAKQPGIRKIYISREDAAVRRITNEAEVQARFRAYGFEVHTLSGLTYEAQKSLFQDASHIASIHGAGLANLAFAHPSTRVFEMMPPNNGSFAYWVMAAQLGMPYTLFTVDDALLDIGPGFSSDLMLNTRDCSVDVRRLDVALGDFMRARAPLSMRERWFQALQRLAPRVAPRPASVRNR